MADLTVAPADSWAKPLVAEEALIGAVLLKGQALHEVASMVRPEDFVHGRNRTLWEAMLALWERGAPVDTVTVTDELDQRHWLADAGGVEYVTRLMSAVPAASSAPHYARMVAKAGETRRTLALFDDAGNRIRGGQDLTSVTAEVAARLTGDRQGQDERFAHGRPGGSMILDSAETPRAVWGAGSEVLWSAGEPFKIVGPQGVGKTTVAQQLLLARIGVRDGLLGFPVAPEPKRVLYISGDRPAQAMRSFGRMVTEDDRRLLDEKLSVWSGPLPFDVTSDPQELLAMARHFDAGTVCIDGVKDIAAGLSDDKVGSAVNLAYQTLVSSGVELVALHWPKKAQADNRKPRTLDDVYGSTWLTAGCGSVVMLWGQPGDLVIELVHLKQPVEPVGPLTLMHDHAGGLTSVQGAVDPLTVLRHSAGMTARGMAEVVHGTADPDRNQVESQRRKLERFVKDGLAQRKGGKRGSRDDAATYYATEAREAP